MLSEINRMEAILGRLEAVKRCEYIAPKSVSELKNVVHVNVYNNRPHSPYSYYQSPPNYYSPNITPISIMSKGETTTCINGLSPY